ncbi:MAG TPA: iron-sulfur cluster repair di-iron protein [Pyrinomonadaceae bacterium]|nr:iron-sulfur cluster repair di-iron protein [Pyrinomonadaceae bacterium]
MLNLTTKTVREIALELPVTTRIFEEFKIDYCCGGRKPFLEACRVAGANPEFVQQKISDIVENTESTEFEWLKESTLTELIKYIVEKHHTFTRDEIQNLTPLMAKVANRHGENHFELFELERVFNELCNDLSEHLLKEERILFPYVEQLERSVLNASTTPFSCFGTVQNPVKMMMLEHDTAGDFLQKMRELTNDYVLPEGACLSYTALLDRLQGFEKDLHQHIHLENNLLFPKAIELEQKVFG